MPRGPNYQKERGARQMQRVLELLATGPKDLHELAEAMHLARSNVGVAIRRLQQRPNRRVYLAGYDLNSGRPRHIYALGGCQDVTVSEFQMDRIHEAMKRESRPWSLERAALMTPMNYASVRSYVRGLKKAGRVHIAAWAWSDRTAYPLYLTGRGHDVPRPKEKPQPARVSRQPASIFAALGIGP